MFFAAALLFASCDSGGGGGSEKPDNNKPQTGGGSSINGTPEWDNNGSAYSIKFYTKTELGVGSGSSDSYKIGFTVTANDVAQEIDNVYVSGGDRVEIIFGTNQSFTGSTVIKMSYDGTGGLAGKLAAFSNVTVTYNANMYAN